MADALFEFETEGTIRKRVAAELVRMAREFERDYPYKMALMFAAAFTRGEECPIGPMAMGEDVFVPEWAVKMLLGDYPDATPEDHEKARERVRRSIADYHARIKWENRKYDSWTAELARGQRTRGGEPS